MPILHLGYIVGNLVNMATCRIISAPLPKRKEWEKPPLLRTVAAARTCCVLMCMCPDCDVPDPSPDVDLRDEETVTELYESLKHNENLALYGMFGGAGFIAGFTSSLLIMCPKLRAAVFFVPRALLTPITVIPGLCGFTIRGLSGGLYAVASRPAVRVVAKYGGVALALHYVAKVGLPLVGPKLSSSVGVLGAPMSAVWDRFSQVRQRVAIYFSPPSPPDADTPNGQFSPERSGSHPGAGAPPKRKAKTVRFLTPSSDQGAEGPPRGGPAALDGSSTLKTAKEYSRLALNSLHSGFTTLYHRGPPTWTQRGGTATEDPLSDGEASSDEEEKAARTQSH